jgi:hypothetical protein
MYRNGKQVRGYAKKLLHKRYVKERYGRRGMGPYGYGGYKSWKDYEANRDLTWGDTAGEKVPWSLQYWKRYYFSGRRKFAKRCTNSRIRARERTLIHREDADVALHGAEYRKMFDYNWTVW